MDCVELLLDYGANFDIKFFVKYINSGCTKIL